jgi:MoxR-like ATPase
MKTIFFKTAYDKTLYYKVLNTKEVEDTIFMSDLSDETLQCSNQAQIFGFPIGTVFVASQKPADSEVNLFDKSVYKDALNDFEVRGNEIFISKIKPLFKAVGASNPQDEPFIDSSLHPAENVNASELESWLVLKIEQLKNDYLPESDEYKSAVKKLEALVENTKKVTKFTFGETPTDDFPSLEVMLNPPKIDSLDQVDKSQKKGGKLGTANIADFIKTNFPRPSLNASGFHVDEDLWILLARNILRKVNTLIVGPTGTGKTEIVQLVASVMGYNFHIQDMGTVIDASSTLQGVHRIKEGKSVFDFAPYVGYLKDPKSVILLDELNRSSLASRNILFPQLDSRRYLPIDSAEESVPRKVLVHEDNAFFATANIGSEYSGTSEIDRALLDRFFPVQLDYMSKVNESKVLVNRTGILKAEADTVVNVLEQIRRLAKSEEITSAVSTRHGLQVAGMIKDGFPMSTSLEKVILPIYSIKDSSGEEVKQVKSVFSSI